MRIQSTFGPLTPTRAGILLILVALAGCEERGRYEIRAAGGSTANEDRVWVLDTATGKVSLCFESAAKIRCLEETQAFGANKK